MKVAEESDGESVKARGPAAKRDILANQPRAIGFDEQGLCPERGDTPARCKTYEISSVNRQPQSILWALLFYQGQNLSRYQNSAARGFAI